jgi:hypothetical protein
MKTPVSIKDVVDEMDVLSHEHSAFLNEVGERSIQLG